jgi:hypothetical protein
MSAVSDEKIIKEVSASEPNLKEQILAMVNVLPAEQLRELLTFVEFLNHQKVNPDQKATRKKWGFLLI